MTLQRMGFGRRFGEKKKQKEEKKRCEGKKNSREKMETKICRKGSNKMFPNLDIIKRIFVSCSIDDILINRSHELN